MTTQRDDATVRRYRAASAALDERPAPATRAAILAAAARQVEARPQAAAAPRAVSGRRWPLAAAAAVLLSTLAVMMATRTEQEMPTFTAPAEQAPEGAVTPTAPAGTADSAAPTSGLPAPVPSPAVGASQTPSSAGASRPASAPPLKKSAPLPAPAKQVEAKEEMATGRAGEPNEAAVRAKRNEELSRAQVRERADASAESRRAFPAAPAAAAPDAPAAIAPAPPPAMDTAASGVGAAPAAKPDGGRAEASPRASAAARTLQGSTRQQNAARDADLSAAEWLDRIVRLRAEGRHADADDELKRFRERYPEVQVPPAALPPTGTR